MREVNGTQSLLVRDHLGSVILSLGTTGLAARETGYAPYGSVAAETVLDATVATETKGYIGERLDRDAGLQYLNARYYDPTLALFTSPDWWEVTEPGVGTNRFSYSLGDPVNNLDPGGNRSAAAQFQLDKYLESGNEFSHAKEQFGYVGSSISGRGGALESEFDVSFDFSFGSVGVDVSQSVLDLPLPGDAVGGTKIDPKRVRGLLGVLGVIADALRAKGVQIEDIKFHYTSSTRYKKILSSRIIRTGVPSETLDESGAPINMRYGIGVYLTDIIPGTMSRGQIAHRLFGNGRFVSKVTHYIGIDTRNLPITNPAPHVFVVATPIGSGLNINGRVQAHGETPIRPYGE